MVTKRKLRPHRLFNGNVPANGVSLGTFEDELGTWELYLMVSKDVEWLNVKVISLNPRPIKANFWLGFNVRKRQFARTPNGKALANYPALHDWVLSVLLQRVPL